MKEKTNYFILFIFTFFAHGLLLISDGIFWDDWLVYTSLLSNEHFLIHRMAFQQGTPTNYYFWLLFSVSSNILFNQRLTVFLMIALSSFVVYKICKEYCGIGNLESLMIALVFITYPAYETWILIITSEYVFYYFSFLLAALISLLMTRQAGPKALALRIPSLLLFYLSYYLNSLLVFYFGFLLFFLILYLLKNQLLPKKVAIINFSFRHLDYLLLPFIFWFIKKIFFPTYGIYAEYNAISFSVVNIIAGVLVFILNGVLYQFSSSIIQVFSSPGLWLILVFLAIVTMKNFREQDFPILQKKESQIGLVGFGAILFCMVILPYAMVGKLPTLHGWETRHFLLISLPVGIILVANIYIFFGKRDGSLHWAGWILFLILLVGFTGQTVDQYVNWQQRWIKDRSVMAKLDDMVSERAYSIFWIKDEFPLIGSVHYQFYEWSSIFKVVWGGEKWVGLPVNIYGDWIIKNGFLYDFRSYNYNNFDILGCQAMLTVSPGNRSLVSSRTLFDYYYFRFLDTSKMDEFLDNITRVTIQPFPSKLATNCQ